MAAKPRAAAPGRAQTQVPWGCSGITPLTIQAASFAQPARGGAAGPSPASFHLYVILKRRCEQTPSAWDLSTSEAKESRNGLDQSGFGVKCPKAALLLHWKCTVKPLPRNIHWARMEQQHHSSTNHMEHIAILPVAKRKDNCWSLSVISSLCTCISNQHYWFSLACTTKLISKQQANSRRKRGKIKEWFCCSCRVRMYLTNSTWQKSE